jgi:hypothetical protein
VRVGEEERDRNVVADAELLGRIVGVGGRRALERWCRDSARLLAPLRLG